MKTLTGKFVTSLTDSSTQEKVSNLLNVSTPSLCGLLLVATLISVL